MELIRCEQGHYYDPSRHDHCPHCEVYGQGDDPGYTVAKAGFTDPAGTAAQGAPAPGGLKIGADDQPTVARARESMGFDPVTGWLVCVHGAARGQQYVIHTERNSIGRGDRMDICIKGDLGISRENHATLSYNPRTHTFTLIPGEGKSIIFLNGQEILAPVRLTAYDRVEISATVLVFMPLCSDVFSWEDEANQ